MNDIICAISTPPGMGAIAVIRLSGKGSIAVADTLFVSPSGKRLADAKANSVLSVRSASITKLRMRCSSPFFTPPFVHG